MAFIETSIPSAIILNSAFETTLSHKTFPSHIIAVMFVIEVSFWLRVNAVNKILVYS